MLDLMSMLPYLKMQNLIQSPSSGVNSNPNDDYNVNDRLADLYHPSNTAQDAYNTNVTNMPNRANYEPSGLRKAGAFLAGLGNIHPLGIEHGAAIGMTGDPTKTFNTTQGILDDPYNQAIGDWQAKNKPLEVAAQNERANNSNQRIMANDVISREIGDRRLDIQRSDVTRKATADENRNTNEQARIKIQQDRATAYEWSKTHPNYEGRVDKDGSLVYVNKSDPSDIVKTGIDTGKMNDFDKINLGIKGRLSEIAAQGSNQQNLQDQRNTNTLGQIDERAKTKVPPTGKVTTTEIDSSGKKKTVTTTPTNSVTNPVVNEEKVQVINPAGVKGFIKKSQLADALKQGYKQVP